MADTVRAPVFDKRPARWRAPEFVTVNLLATTLKPATQAPFSQKDWPNPRVKKRFINELFPNLQGTTLAASITLLGREPLQISRVAKIRAQQNFEIPNLLSHTLGGGANISVALTGIAATMGIGSLGVQFAITPSGIAATGAPGSVIPSPSVGLSGVAATGSAGSVSPSSSVALSGVDATVTPGSLLPGIEQSISGVVGTLSAGSLGVATSIALTGTDGTALAGTITYTLRDVTVALTGVSMTAHAGSVTADGSEPTLDATYFHRKYRRISER